MTHQHLALLQAIKAKTKENQTELALRLGISQVTVSRWFRRVDQPHHNQRLKIESVARRLGIIPMEGDDARAPMVGTIKAGGLVEWADKRGREMATEALSGLVYLTYEGPASLDGFIQPGCQIWFDADHTTPDATSFGRACIIYPADKEHPPRVGVLRGKVSASARDRTYRVQEIGTGKEILVRVADVAFVRRIVPPA